MKKKFAMTLSEVTITLMIISVVAALTIPTLMTKRPDKDAIMFRKAFVNVSEAFNKASMDAEVQYCGGWNWKETGAYASTAEDTAKIQAACKEVSKSLCDRLAKYMNTAGAVKCNIQSSYLEPNFKTTDGLMFWGLENGFTSSDGNSSADEHKIFIERPLTAGELTRLASLRKHSSYAGTKTVNNKTVKVSNGLKMALSSDGGVYVPQNTDSVTYTYELNLLEKASKFLE